MIVLSDVTLQRGTKVLLQQASVTLNPGEKIALVGRNGAGKSSLFGLLNGSLHEDSGDIHMPPHWQLAQVAQQMPETAETATQFVLAGDTRLQAAQAALTQAENSGDGMAIAHAHAALADAGAHDAVARAQTLILGLGFAVDELQRPVNSFSGGWRMRLQLARALMCPSDLLLLDEPTNHLDLDALIWLEGWLKRYQGTLLMISHDREFLDAVTQVTIHIENAKLTRYGGNYSAFEEMRAQQIMQQQAAFARQQDKIAHLQKFIDRFKAKATKAKQAQSRFKALQRMERIAPVLTSADFSFSFQEPPQLPNPMLSIKDASFGYAASDQGSADTGTEPTIILKGVNRSVVAGQRIGVLGANGQGKSTFVKTIAHDLPLLAGQITEGKGLRIGYFAQQELDVLRPDDTPLAHMIRLAKDHPDIAAQHGKEQDLRNFLGSFQFSGDMVNQPVGSMSGGEKARLALAMIVWQQPNLLLLDEPTNHLDLNMREALAMALNAFEGTVMLVSHDRALLRSVCDEFWLVGNGGISPFDGDLEDYQSYLLDLARQKREALGAASQTAAQGKGQEQGKNSAPNTTQSAAQKPALSGAEQRRQQAALRQEYFNRRRPLQKKAQALEMQMEQQEAEKTVLEQRLYEDLSPQDRADIGKQLKQVLEKIENAENEWMDISAQLEELEASYAVQSQSA